MVLIRQREAPEFQRFLLGAGRELAVRIADLRKHYRRHLVLAGVLSVALHGLLGYSLRTEVEWPEQTQPIGLEGAIKVVDIQPVDRRLDVEQRELSRSLQRTGALTAMDIEPEETSAEAEAEAEIPEPIAPNREVRLPVFEAPPPVVPEESPGEPVRIELDESWKVDPSSPEAALSEQFNPQRIVVPEYPERAFDRDVQGVVRLEARVGISGKVLDVRVLEAQDSDLSLAAQRAMLMWQFKPYVVHGRPTPFRIVVPFRFRIVD